MASKSAADIAFYLSDGGTESFSYSYIGNTTEGLEAQIAAITVPIILMLILIVGLVGNSIVIYVILKAGHGRVKSATNSYIINLAITDISFLVCCVPGTASMYAWKEWMFGDFMCKLVFFMMHAAAQATCLTLTAMSVDRYQAIVRPLKSMQNRSTKMVSVIIIIIWIFSFVTASPVFIFSKMGTHSFYIDVHLCVEDWPAYQTLFPAYALYCFIMMYLLPLAVISLCYLGVLIKVWDQVMPGLDGAHLQYRAKEVRQRRHVTWMVLAVVMTFAFCWLPLYICNIWQRFSRENFPETVPMYIFKLFGIILVYTNSCVNPFIYSFMGENFRRYFRRACPFLCKEKNHRFQVAGSRRTGTTVIDEQPMVDMRVGSTLSDTDQKVSVSFDELSKSATK
ncbi:G-protein coupled receptor 54-like [Apostichopus japonicus]|uniref:G-protein coupled receptor 54-like n=1 Tax=Stichopus japonicus TaxID=307972 RepID=UPI003AB8AC68